MRTEITTLGRVPVDSGSLCIVDPCYLVPGQGHNPMTHDGRMKDGEFLFAHQNGTGLIFGGFGGDGNYVVKAEKGPSGLINRVIIDLEGRDLNGEDDPVDAIAKAEGRV